MSSFLDFVMTKNQDQFEVDVENKFIAHPSGKSEATLRSGTLEQFYCRVMTGEMSKKEGKEDPYIS